MNDGVADQFPAGLRVLVVDDDPTCLMILEKMLRSCRYEVTKCTRAEVALKYLRDTRDGFDVVISDVHMPDMDGFKLLEQVGLEMDLPSIMMSADDSKSVVMKGVTHGACDYLIKPVRMEALKNIWQHVVRKKKHEWKDKDLEQSGSIEDGERLQKPSEDVDYSSSANEGSWKGSKKRKDEEDDLEDRDDTSALKKPRVVWSVELHQQFITAVNQLGIDKAVPKKILELMNVPGLTRENVASHLQKYRLYLRRLSVQRQNGLGNSFMGHQDSHFGPITSFSGLDLQALASSGQLQAAALSRTTNKSPSSVPVIDQRNIFSYDNSKIRFVDGQQQHNNVMSADDSKSVVMKGITHGMEALKNIWQHVVRKKKHVWKDKDLEQSGSIEDGERLQKPSEDVDYSSSANEGSWKGSKKRKDEEDDLEYGDDTSALKKPRVVWPVELHQQFVTAVNQLGINSKYLLAFSLLIIFLWYRMFSDG